MAILNINRDWQLALQLQSLIIIILILKETSSCIAWSGLFVPPIHQMAFTNNYFNLKLANPKRLSPSYDIVISPFRGSSRFMDYDDTYDWLPQESLYFYFVGDMIDSFLSYMIDFYQHQGSFLFLCLWWGRWCWKYVWVLPVPRLLLNFAFDEGDVENMLDSYLYQGCVFADIWNQETRNSRSLSRSFWWHATGKVNIFDVKVLRSTEE